MINVLYEHSSENRIFNFYAELQPNPNPKMNPRFLLMNPNPKKMKLHFQSQLKPGFNLNPNTEAL